MNTLLTLFLFFKALELKDDSKEDIKKSPFQIWFSQNMMRCGIGFLLFGIIDWVIIINYFKILYNGTY